MHIIKYGQSVASVAVLAVREIILFMIIRLVLRIVLTNCVHAARRRYGARVSFRSVARLTRV